MSDPLDELLQELQQRRQLESMHPGLQQQILTGQAPRSPGGFLGNLLGGVGDIAMGVGNLMMAAGHDIFLAHPRRAASLLPGIDAPEDQRFMLAEIARAAPGAIGQDIRQRYGSGREAFLQGLYEHPLAFGIDVATIGTLGGLGAAKGAQAAGRAALAAGREPGRVTRAILPGIGKVDDAGRPIALGGERTVLDPTQLRPQVIDRPYNPLTRVFKEQVVERPMTKSVAAWEKELRTIDRSTTMGRANAELLETKIRLANEFGVTRVDRQFRQNLKLRKMFARVQGERSSAHIAWRDRWMQPYGEHWQALEEAVKQGRVRPERLDEFDLTLQGISRAEDAAGHLTRWKEGGPTHFVPASAGRLSTEEIVAALRNPEITSHPMGRAVAEAVEAHRPVMERAVRTWGSVEQEAARRFLEMHAGEALATLRAGQGRLGAQAVDDIALAADQFRVTNFGQEALQLARTWDDARVVGPYQTLLERAYKPVYMTREGIANKRWDFPATKPGERPAVFRIDDAIKAEGKKPPVYMPHYESLKGMRSDFLLSQGLFRMRRAAEPKAHKRSRGELFHRRMTELKDAYERDPMLAYQRVAAEAVKKEETANFLVDMAETFGRRIDARGGMPTLDQVSRGERVMNPDGVYLQIRRQIDSDLEMASALERGANWEDALAAGVRKAFDNLTEDMATYVAERGALFAVPKVVADRMEAIAKTRLGGPKARLFYEGPTNLWKNTVLSWRPGWYTYNTYGNTAFNAILGGRFTGVLRQALSKKYREAVRQAIPEELRGMVETPFTARLVQRPTHLGAAGETAAGQIAQRIKVTRGAEVMGTATQRLQNFNVWLENLFRREGMIRSMEKAAVERNIKLTGNSFFRSQKRLEEITAAGANPRLAAKAVEETNRAFGNFLARTPFERNIIVRYFAPFWSFYKHATTLLVSLPWTHPAKASLLQKLSDVDKQFADVGPTPDWLRGALPIGEGTAEGATRFFMSRGANPFSELGGAAERRWRMPINLLGPIPKAGVELGMGHDVFTGRQFSSPDTFRRFGSQQRYDIHTGEPTTVRPTELEFLFRSVPHLKLGRDIVDDIRGPLGARYTATGEIIPDRITGEPLYPIDSFQKLLQFLGISTTDFDLTNFQQQWMRDQEALQQERMRRGLYP